MAGALLQEGNPDATPRGASGEAEAPHHAAHSMHDMRDIISEAFAGDDVMADFEKEKVAVAQESVALVEDPSGLPGWGLWANRKREPECVPAPAHETMVF
jgi:U3 small nucleolar RNA-associated protein 14